MFFWLTEERLVPLWCLLYNMYLRVDHLMNKYLKHIVAAGNTRASEALGEMTLVISLCRTDQFNRSFLPAALRLCNVLPSGVFSGDSLLEFF